ncbi:hypothetical protein PO80_20595 [Vibrio parahaemolyticus]|uniref:hypothetical protein n=1 Tax=Vibrio parahaemolyticus TaxID=670 RepID=UPI0005432B5C|nr:hypothetical protein [Vibrio parahaemolyticus]KHF12507.1 hypothetical protein PO80_20595 [Vibrio parahaemolyticus]OTW03828.1 hypothetical protein BA739_00035 [Vibrio parahaemolyticus]OTW10889.1 hypothetical protein BA740_00035 [Vibrio parahaemolyticus]
MNNYELSLSWKILIPLSKNTPDYYNSDLFKCISGNSFIRKIGGIEDFSFAPVTLEPTVVFYNSLFKIKNEYSFSGKKFPYKDKHGNSINFNIRLHKNKFIVITVSILDFVKSDIKDIKNEQNLKQHIELYNLVKYISGLIVSGDTKNLKPMSSLKVYPCTVVYSCEENNAEIPDSVAVEILTRHSDLRGEIVNSVINKNDQHQLNSSNILVDRQGIFSRIPFSLYKNSEVKKKHFGSSNLFELSIVIYKLLSNKHTILSDGLIKDLDKIINHPDLFIINSVTARKTLELLISEFNLVKLFNVKLSEHNEVSLKENVEKDAAFKRLIKTTEFQVFVLATIFGLLAYIYNISPIKPIVEDYISHIGNKIENVEKVESVKKFDENKLVKPSE